MEDIFVVEDSKFDRAKIKDVLTEFEYSTQYFSEAEEVLKIVEDKKRDKISKLFSQKNSVAFEYSLLFDNNRKYYETKMLNLQGEDQKCNIIVSVRDISERKENSLQLEKLSREYETIFNINWIFS